MQLPSLKPYRRVADPADETGTVGRNRTTHVCCARGFIVEQLSGGKQRAEIVLEAEHLLREEQARKDPSPREPAVRARELARV
jgi:hypothetical protein